jgi:hypothetical protein
LERRQRRVDRREQSRNAELTLKAASIHGTDLRKAVRERTFGSRGQSPRYSPADAKLRSSRKEIFLMKPREVSSSQVVCLSPLALPARAANRVSSHALGFCEALRTPEADSGWRRPPLSSFYRKCRLGAAHAAQAGSFSAGISTGRMSGRPSSSSSARPSRAAATAP